MSRITVWTTAGLVIVLWILQVAAGKWSHPAFFGGLVLILLSTVAPVVIAAIAALVLLRFLLSNPGVVGSKPESIWSSLRGRFLS